MDVQLEIAEHVRSTPGAEGTVLLDLRSGKYFALNGVGSLLWEAIAAGASRGEALERLAERFPEVPTDRLGHDADALLAQLQAKGLLHSTDQKRGPSPAKNTMAPAGTPRTEGEGTAAQPGASLFWTLTAYLGLLVSDAVLKILGFSRFHAMVRRIPTRPAVRSRPAAAQRIVRSVDRASAFYFKRAWCLQRSAVTVALLRLAGLPARLVIGVRRVPFYAHAWAELDGRVANDQPAVRREFEVLETC